MKLNLSLKEPDHARPVEQGERPPLEPIDVIQVHELLEQVLPELEGVGHAPGEVVGDDAYIRGVVDVLEEAEHVIVGGAHVVRRRKLDEVHAEVGGQLRLVGGVPGAELGHSGGGGHPAVGDLDGDLGERLPLRVPEEGPLAQAARAQEDAVALDEPVLDDPVEVNPLAVEPQAVVLAGKGGQ